MAHIEFATRRWRHMWAVLFFEIYVEMNKNKLKIELDSIWQDQNV